MWHNTGNHVAKHWEPCGITLGTMCHNTGNQLEYKISTLLETTYTETHVDHCVLSGIIAGGVGSKSKDGYGCELNKPINTKERVTVL